MKRSRKAKTNTGADSYSDIRRMTIRSVSIAPRLQIAFNPPIEVPVAMIRTSKPWVIDPTLLAIGQKARKTAFKAREKKLRNLKGIWLRYQKRVDELHSNCPGMPNSELIKVLAEEFGCDPKTISRNTRLPS